MQQSVQMMPPPTLTTDQIQKCLDENKKLILAILENQNLGKLAECAQFQNQLQKNLMYLAAVADAQPQVTTAPPQLAAQHPTMPQGAFFMQHPQAAAATATAMGQQPVMFPPKSPMQYNSLHQMHNQQQLHSQSGQMGMRPVGMHYPAQPDAVGGCSASAAGTSSGGVGEPK